jgi:hypothetical protein
MFESNRGRRPGRLLAVVGWIVAGVPLLVSSLQAVARLLGTPVGTWPVLGSAAAVVHGIRIFRLMSVEFNSPSPLILLLFVLISISWVLLGLSLFQPMSLFDDYSRELRTGSALMSAVLYTFLFVGVYWNLWFGPVSLVERAVLSTFPLTVLAGILLVYLWQPTSTCEGRLNRAEQALTEKTNAFDRLTDELIREFERLDPRVVEQVSVDPESVVEDRREERFGPVTDSLERYRDSSLSESECKAYAEELLRTQIEPLEPDDVSASVAADLRRELASWFRETYVDVEIRSAEFDRPYVLENFGRYRTISVPRAEPSQWQHLNVNGLDQIADQLSDDIGSLRDAVAVVNAVSDHFDGPDGVRRDLEDREEGFVETTDAVTNRLRSIDDRLRELPGQVGQRMVEIYRQGYLESIDHMGVIASDYGPTNAERGKLDEAIDAHHECLFDDAVHAAEEAEEMATHLDAVVSFVEHVVYAADDGVSAVEVPDLGHVSYSFFEPSIIENEVGSRLAGVRLLCDWERGRIEFRYDESQEATVDVESAGEADDEIPQSRIENGVEFVLSGLKDGEVGDRDGSLVSLRRENLPGIYSSEEIIERAAEYLRGQDDLVTRVHDDSLPAHLEFEVDPEITFRRAMNELLTRVDG